MYVTGVAANSSIWLFNPQKAGKNGYGVSTGAKDKASLYSTSFIQRAFISNSVKS